MRERTPSDDDTLVRAPPTPLTPPTPPIPPKIDTETESAKVIVDPGSLVALTVGPVASVNSNNKKMVASSHSLEELGVTHPASASGDRGAPETNRTAQTALDKRSRLSNVINNLRKKVPEPQPSQQQKNDNDGRNSVERNLENIEKYVMTVLNGVIKDEAEKKDKDKVETGIPSSGNKESGAHPANVEASYPGKIEDEEWPSVVVPVSGGEGAKGAENADEALEGAKNLVEDVPRDFETPVSSVSLLSEENAQRESGKTDPLDDSIGGAEPERESTVEKSAPTDSPSPEDPANLMDVCRELMSDLLNNINQLIEGSRDQEIAEPRFSASSQTSLHCSLPLEKVAPILRSCGQENQTPVSPSPQRSPSRPSPPTVRHLCLYCDRKFVSISLRQRHAERVHQVGGGSRRSERNSRRTVQGCQYCSEGSDPPEAALEPTDTLDSLFRHMAKAHPDRYYACLKCSTRYATRETLANHSAEVHRSEERIPPKEQAEPKPEEEAVKKEASSNPASPEFDSSFYSSVSCNIRENLLHHLDGKLQPSPQVLPLVEAKPQQNFYDAKSSQIQLPIDISLTAATPVYNSKDASGAKENSSEYAQRPGKTRTHPRRVSFEKYNFPRKYDGKEPWSCSIKDLSKFDISTQLTLRKKQQLTKASNATIGRLSSGGSAEQATSRQGGLAGIGQVEDPADGEAGSGGHVHDALGTASVPSEDSEPNSPRCSDLNTPQTSGAPKSTVFTSEFANFMRLKRWDEDLSDGTDHREVAYAELTGEWSRPRIYVCGACADRHVTMKEMEEHKASAHPNVWCSHFEFAGDQRELYKHLFVPGKSSPNAKARAAISPDKICTKCSRNCNTLAELHRHMLECGGDQTWLLGLFGNGKKKCKWRPFGSRSRRRRQRGMKRNIQNSQTPRANTPKERPTNGPRVRPSDRESIQKMLANLPPKRASRKVLREENLARSREAAQTVQTRSRPRMSAEVSSSVVQSRNKTVLKNKLLKNAKSFQRNRSRIDNITAAIESVVTSRLEPSVNPESKRTEDLVSRLTKIAAKNVLRVLSKKKNVKTKDSTIANIEHPRTRGRPFGGTRVSNRSKDSKPAPKLPASSPTPKISGRAGNSAKGKIQSAETIHKDSSEPEDTEEKTPPRTRRKKLVDPIASLNASIKAKQQLRTNDGKFARGNLGGRDDGDEESAKVLRDRYPRRHLSAVEFVPKSRIKATRDFGRGQIKRSARAASDAEKMPTLEPADGEPADKPARGNEIPILSLAGSRGASEKDETEKGEGLDLDDVLEKSVIDVAELKSKFKAQRKLEADQKRSRGSRGRRISPAVAPPTPAATSASSSSSGSSSTSSSPLTRVEMPKNQRRFPRRKEDEKPVGTPGKEDLVTRLDPDVGKRRPRRSGRTSLSKERGEEPSPQDNPVSSKKTHEKNSDEDREAGKLAATRKSPRNLAPKNLTKPRSSESVDNHEDDERVGEKTPEEPEDEPEEALAEEPKRGRALGKRRGRIKATEASCQTPKTEDEGGAEEALANLSLEHLQRESSNSNVDSGKENSSETRISLPKPRVVKPRKTKSGRQSRDRTVTKRTLGSVIGILTEGVNIPVDIPPSVVLTVQTASLGSGSEGRPEDEQRGDQVRQEKEIGGNKSEETDDLVVQRLETGSESDTSEVSDPVNDPTLKGHGVEPPATSRTLEAQETTDSEPAPAGKRSSEEKPADTSNDIIMDLSRRKPKGKGSFLEKIVSKIAKQKDVLLEGDVGSLLDNAAEELTNILDEVAPNLSESTENLNIPPNENSQGIGSCQESETKASPGIGAAMLMEGSETVTETVAEEGPSLEESQFIREEASLDSNSKKRAFETNSPKKNKRKSVDAEPVVEPEDLVGEELCLADIMRLIQSPKTNGEKDGESSRPGKRKPADINDREIFAGRIEDDELEQQGDLKDSSNEEVDSKRPRRKSAKKTSLVEEHLLLLDKEESPSSVEKGGSEDTGVSKSSKTSGKKINKRKTVANEDPQLLDKEAEDHTISNSTGNPSAKRRSVLGDEKNTEGLQEPRRRSSKRKSSLASGEIAEDRVENNSANIESEKCNEDCVSKAKNVKRFADGDLSPEPGAPEGSKDSGTKSATKKRKSVSETAKPEEQSGGDESKTVEVLEETKRPKTSVAAEDFRGTRRRRSCKRPTSLVEEHLGLDSDDSVSSSKTDADTKSESSEVSERRRTLRRRNSKRKSMAEYQLDLFDDEDGILSTEPFKVPEISEVHSRTRRSSKRSLSSVEAEIRSGPMDQEAGEQTESPKRRSSGMKSSIEPPETELTQDPTPAIPPARKAENLGKSLVNEHLELSDEDGEKLAVTDSTERKIGLDESAVSNTENGISVADDQQQVPIKRGSGNFTVGHTKTGEILIVEKKKKLTKEVARFFCEVCATSFTRKSSLKKHNSSQSHLMQVSKSETAPEAGADVSALEGEEKDEQNDSHWGSEDSLEAADESFENLSNLASKNEPNRLQKNPLTPQRSEEEALEEELLDEEICKITENMTHDDFVLTDHISPEIPAAGSLAVKTDDNRNKPESVKSSKGQKTKTPKLKKINLAEEHLDLDSPSPMYEIRDSEEGNAEDALKKSFTQRPTSHDDLSGLKESLASKMAAPLAQETVAASSSLITERFCPKSLKKIEDIPPPKVSKVVSIPVTIHRDVLVPSDESLSDKPLAEVLMKTAGLKTKDTQPHVTPEDENSTRIVFSTPQESSITLDFTNIAEKLRKSPSDKRRPNDVEFESDDSSIDTRISVDIRKLLDEPELSADNYVHNKSVGILGEREKSRLGEEEEIEPGEKEDKRGKRARDKVQRQNEGSKSSARKHSRNPRSVKPKRRPKMSDSSEDENSEIEATSESRNKNKIVKSVFGRVFGDKLEKVDNKIQDKVKEVLDDWDSRSDEDAARFDRDSPGSKRTSRSKKRRNRSKTKTREEEERRSAVGTESRSRRSKKRAEERISKAFEEESTSVAKENSYFDNKNNFPISSDHLKNPDSKGSTKIEGIPKTDNDQWAIFSGGADKPLLKQSTPTRDSGVVPKIEDSPNRVPPLNWPSMLPSPAPSSPGQSSVARSSIRNRSPTPDRNSQSSRASDSDEAPCGRLSPLFIRNTPDTSMDSGDSNEEVFSTESKKSDLVVSSSLRAKATENEFRVITIAPNDAVEDNALDVPRAPALQSNTTSQKPRQAKVLNFDEELFVECCSRLKATTENELRGAKKIEIDHSDAYHLRRDPDGAGFRSIRDRWRDAESQNSLGSLLESVNQLLGEEMYANNEKDYSKHAARDPRSENSSRSGSPDLEVSRPPDNLGYEDSLDVAFEHNNKLRDKIQQRMRASENLIANSFACETPAQARHSYGEPNSNRIHPIPGVPTNESLDTPLSKGAMAFDERHAGKNASLDTAGFKHKMTSTLGGLLDKLALSNLLHSTAKHDHNGSTPMKVLAELACARAPTTTACDLKPEIISVMESKQKDFAHRKIRNPIRELFERKKELNDRNQTEKTRAVAVAVAALKKLNVQRRRKTTKRSKKRAQEFPLVRKNPYGGMAERKKRRDVSFEKKSGPVIRNDKVKDIYDFDDEESQPEVTMPNVVSFRTKTIGGNTDLATLASKTIVETLENGKEADVLGRRLESMIDRKFKEVEKSAPKTKGALKAFQNEKSNQKATSEADSGLARVRDKPSDEGQEAVGPMDDFVQRKQTQQLHKQSGETAKRSKSKKRSKNGKKKSRIPAWYENDSSDEFRTAAKTEDIGVGISKSQRTCSKGKQNLFAELSSTSSESEIEDVDLEYGAERDFLKGQRDEADLEAEPEEQKKTRKYSETKKSESEMSDHPLIIDERRESDEESSARNNYEPSFEMDDLYREDSSDEGDTECPEIVEEKKTEVTGDSKTKFMQDDELIPLEEALDLLDPPEALAKDDGTKDPETEEEERPLSPQDFQGYAQSPAEKTRQEEELVELPEKLSSNEKPAEGSDNLPLHVFLSRKVQESKKRKQQHLKKLQEEQEKILLELQPTRRQRKCAVGKQGLLAEISSSDEDSYDGGNCRKFQDKERSGSLDKPRRQKRESREKRKERYIEKKHEQIIAKEQKAIEEEILRELGKNSHQAEPLDNCSEVSFDKGEHKTIPKKQKKQRPKKLGPEAGSTSKPLLGSESENNVESTASKSLESPSKQKKQPKTESQRSPKKSSARAKKHSECNGKEARDNKERKSLVMKRDSTDEELRTTKSWNKVEEGVGVAIGRRKRAAANQLYYWSSSSDEEEVVEEPIVNAEEEDDRQEQHGWIVGDSHKRMITMLAMEKQLKEKRRRSEDEFEPNNKSKNKKHRNSTS